MHMRSGNALSLDPMSPLGKIGSMEQQQPPCAFYDWIIQHGQYSRVRVITELVDPFNPCAATLAARNPNVKVTLQSCSLQADAWSLLTARHLVIASSFFSIVMSAMSERARVVYYLSGPSDLVTTLFSRRCNRISLEEHAAEGGSSSRARGTAARPGWRAVAVHVPGVDLFRQRTTVQQKVAWMLQYDVRNISRAPYGHGTCGSW